MRHLDLFSGIGGFALAASRVWDDHEVVSFCDIEPFARKVLKKHWPDVPCHDDIKTMKGYDYANIDLLTGGFPCQPYSTAGQRRGSEDDRHLWPEMLRIIRECKPNWIVGENVRGLTNWNEGVVFDEVLSDLEAEGYTVQSFLLPACAVDAPHRRDRIWIVAHSRHSESQGRNESQTDHQGCSRERLSEGSESAPSCDDVANANDTRNRTPKHETEREGEKVDKRPEGLSQSESSRLSKDVADTSSRGCPPFINTKNGTKKNIRRESHIKQGGSDVADTTGGRCQKCEPEGEPKGNTGVEGKPGTCNAPYSESIRLRGGSLRADARDEPANIESRNQGGGKIVEHIWEWLPEPNVGRTLDGVSSWLEPNRRWSGDWEQGIPRVATGVKDRVNRLKGLGNAIVPQVAEMIFRAIANSFDFQDSPVKLTNEEVV